MRLVNQSVMHLVDEIANPNYVTANVTSFAVALTTLGGRIGTYIRAGAKADMFEIMPELCGSPHAGQRLMKIVKRGFDRDHKRYGSDFYESASKASQAFIKTLDQLALTGTSRNTISASSTKPKLPSIMVECVGAAAPGW